MVNSTNFTGMRPSVHASRVNVSNRYHMNAMAKAARAPIGGDSIFLMAAPAPQHCHVSGFTKTLMAINSGLGGFLAGFGLTTNNPNATSGGMAAMGGMPMGSGMGMPGMNGGMPGMNGGMPGMGGGWFGGFFG